MNTKFVSYAVIAFLLCACVPVIEKGEYISFEKTPEIKVLEMGIPERRDFSPVRAIRYELKDKLFKINIELGKNGRWAAFSTESHSGEKLELQLVNRTNLQNEQACIFIIEDISNEEIQYLKLQLWNSGCETYYDGINDFDVAVVHGDKILGIKKFLFEIKEGGHYVWIDAL